MQDAVKWKKTSPSGFFSTSDKCTTLWLLCHVEGGWAASTANVREVHSNAGSCIVVVHFSVEILHPSCSVVQPTEYSWWLLNFKYRAIHRIDDSVWNYVRCLKSNRSCVVLFLLSGKGSLCRRQTLRVEEAFRIEVCESENITVFDALATSWQTTYIW